MTELVRGRIVYQRLEQREPFRINIEVEELVEPVLKGAGLRTHRIWIDGKLGNGHTYQYSLEDAIACADTLVQSYNGTQVSMLWNRVNVLQAANAALKAEVEALREGRYYERI